jgi:hypothetical protein
LSVLIKKSFYTDELPEKTLLYTGEGLLTLLPESALEKFRKQAAESDRYSLTGTRRSGALPVRSHMTTIFISIAVI